MSVKKYFARKYVLYWLVGVGAFLLVFAGVMWCWKLSVTPERVFWGMIDQSLKTSGVTMSSTSQQGESTLEQSIQYSLGGQNRAMSHTTLVQGGAEVKTQVIGTVDADYTRYAYIKTDQKNANGQPLDVSKVLNVWAKTDNKENTSSPLLSQAILGLTLPLGSLPVPIGNLNPEQRASLVKQIHQEGVYEPSFKDVKKETKNGRVLYTYKIKIQTIPYVHLMKEFAKKAGLHDLDAVEPNNYQGEPLTVELTVDARARQLVAVHIPDSDFHQTFSGYGIPVAAEIPKNSIPASELQNRLNELQ